MGNFNKFDKGRGSRGFGGRGGGPKQMHPATCSQCGQSCEVPFKPTGDRPVFCNSCFKKQGGPSPRFAPKSFGGGSRGGNAGVTTGGAVSKAQFDSLNAKLDKILAILAPKMDVPEVKEKKEKKEKRNASAKGGSASGGKKSKGKKK